MTIHEAKQQVISDFYKTYLPEALRTNNGNVSRTATAIGIRRQSLQQLLRKYGINARYYKVTQ